jgi:hypothetical protein
MHKLDQNGSTAVALDVVFAVLFVAAAAFGAWAFMGRQDYKNNTDQKISTAVETAKTAQAAQLNKQFTEEYKKPNKTYQSSPTFGSISLLYPKTWSAYIDESSSSEPINGYFFPDAVPGVQSGTSYALRLQLLDASYSQVVQQYSSLVKQGKVRSTAYVPPLMAGKANVHPGTRFDGAISRNQNGDNIGSTVVLQVRDKTLKVTTESPKFLPDYNNTVLANLTFVP